MTKSETIKQSLLKTKEKRKSQTCKVFELKFDVSHLSKVKLDYMRTLFLEAKWLYNFQLSSPDIFKVSDKTRLVEILNKDKIKENREIKNLSSQMIQGLVDRTKQNIINLSKAKKNGNTIGRLRFTSAVNSIPLKQFNNTYKIVNEKYISLQGFKGRFKVIGLNQIPENSDFANAVLIRRAGNYYLKITTFQKKISKSKTNSIIGLDFGIKDSVVGSNGEKHNYQFPETKRLKKLSKKMNRAKGVKNKWKLRCQLKKEYGKMTNRKKDTTNKFVSKLVKENDVIVIQDEMIHNWAKSGMKGFGRKVQHGIIGGIISSLKKKEETVVIPRSFPSTQLCPVCEKLNKHSLDKRVYFCSCGYVQDRDTHSAKNILNEGLKQIGRESINQMLSEKNPILNLVSEVKQEFSMMKEANDFSRW
jgi:putative transposase